MPARRVYASSWLGGYRPDVRHHDPFRPVTAHRYDVPQIRGESVMAAERRDGPLRIFALVDRYPPQVNAGGEWMLHHLLRPLAAAGHTVDVATATVDPYSFEGVDVWPRRLSLGARGSDDMIRPLADDADVMIGHLMWTREAVEVAADSRTPLVYIAHNHRQLRHWSLEPENMTVLVVNSRWLAERIHTSGSGRGVASWSGPTVIVRPPVHVADYALDRDPAGAPFVTMVNMTAEKGESLFYRLADQPPARRWLAVEGGYGSQVHPGTQHPSVEWQPQTGQIRDDVYARTRVLLMPSEYESWGRVGVEAMASGIPVVAHPTDGLRESLGDAGLFVDRTDLRAWQDALAMLDDPDTYWETSDRARQRAAELDRQADADQVRFELTIRAAAAATGVRSGRTPAPTGSRT